MTDPIPTVVLIDMDMRTLRVRSVTAAPDHQHTAPYLADICAHAATTVKHKGHRYRVPWGRPWRTPAGTILGLTP